MSNKIQVIYPNGSDSNPPILTYNQRVVIENLFKTINCYAVTELYLKNEVSGKMEWFPFNTTNTGENSYGLRTSSNETQIIIRSARHGVVASCWFDGNPWDISTITRSAPFRVRVIKLGD